MNANMENMMNQQAKITELMGEMKHLKSQNMEQQKKMISLENRLDNLKQYSRLNDVIISGLKVKPQSFLQAVKGPALESSPEHDSSTEEQVKAFLNSKKIDIDIDSIKACHTLPTKSQKDKTAIPAIIIWLANRKHKVNLLKQGKKLKGSDVYLNEHLTKKKHRHSKKSKVSQETGQDSVNLDC